MLLQSAGGGVNENLRHHSYLPSWKQIPLSLLSKLLPALQRGLHLEVSICRAVCCSQANLLETRFKLNQAVLVVQTRKHSFVKKENRTHRLFPYTKDSLVHSVSGKG